MPAAVNLLQRAAKLFDDDQTELGWLLPELGSALTQAGNLPEAERVLAEAVRRASERGEPVYEAHALVGLLFARLRFEIGPAAHEVRRRFADLVATFTASGDDLGLDRAWRLRALVYWLEARSGDAEAAWEVGVEHARRAGDDEGLADALCWLASSAFSGPMPVVDGIARCEAIRIDLRGNPRAEAFVLQPLAGLWAMRGEYATARELLAQSNSILDELGITMLDRGSLLRGLRRAARRRSGGGRGLASRRLSVAARERREGSARRHRRDARPRHLRPGSPRRGVRADP